MIAEFALASWTWPGARASESVAISEFPFRKMFQAVIQLRAPALLKFPLPLRCPWASTAWIL